MWPLLGQKPTLSALCTAPREREGPTGLPPPRGRPEVPKQSVWLASPMGAGQLRDTALVKAKRHQHAHESLGKGLNTPQPWRECGTTGHVCEVCPDLCPGRVRTSLHQHSSNLPMPPQPTHVRSRQVKPLLLFLMATSLCQRPGARQGYGTVWGKGNPSSDLG